MTDQDPVRALASIVQGLAPGAIKNLLGRSKAVAAATASYAAFEMGQGLTPLQHALLVVGPACLYVVAQGYVDAVAAKAGKTPGG